MNKRFALFQLAAFIVIMHYCMYADQDSFVIAKNTVEDTQKNALREKKYSELQEDLICLYEEVLRLQIEKLHALAQAQNDCVNSLEKIIKNMPQMSRDRIKKEIMHMEKLKKEFKNMVFF